MQQMAQRIQINQMPVYLKIVVSEVREIVLQPLEFNPMFLSIVKTNPINVSTECQQVQQEAGRVHSATQTNHRWMRLFLGFSRVFGSFIHVGNWVLVVHTSVHAFHDGIGELLPCSQRLASRWLATRPTIVIILAFHPPVR